MKAVLQKWEETEAGWGSRPDGISLHLHEGMRTCYIRMYWDKMPDETPSEYSRPSFEANYDVDVSDDLFQQMDALRKQGIFGLRFYQHEIPKDIMYMPL